MSKPITGIIVDASYTIKNGVLQYRGCDIATGKQLFLIAQTVNESLYLTNVGEFLALVEGVKCSNMNELKLPIYSDSSVALNWVKKGYFNTHVKKSDWLYSQMEDALRYVRTLYEPDVRKWETKLWGENPADFGNKGNKPIYPITC